MDDQRIEEIAVEGMDPTWAHVISIIHSAQAVHEYFLKRQMDANECEEQAHVSAPRIPHERPDDCPTYYDGCNCTTDVLRDALSRVKAQEEELRALRERLEAAQEGSARLQKHRDEWRGYAYGVRAKPDDFLDGNMNPRPLPLAEMTAMRLAEAEAELQRFRGRLLCIAQWAEQYLAAPEIPIGAQLRAIRSMATIEEEEPVG